MENTSEKRIKKRYHKKLDKPSKVLLAIALGYVLFVIVAVIGFFVANHFYKGPSAEKMLKHYSNDAYYRQCEGTFVEIEDEEKSIFKIDSMMVYKDGAFVSYYRKGLSLRIFSDNPTEIISVLNASEEKNISFVTVLNNYWLTTLCPCVEIKIGNLEILSLEEGKNALLNHVSQGLMINK